MVIPGFTRNDISFSGRAAEQYLESIRSGSQRAGIIRFDPKDRLRFKRESLVTGMCLAHAAQDIEKSLCGHRFKGGRTCIRIQRDAFHLQRVCA